MFPTCLFLWLVLVAACFLTIGSQGKPSLSWKFPPLVGALGPAAPNPAAPSPLIKSYSGQRIRNDTIRMVYYHDQTVAVAELQKDKQLLACELIEIYEHSDIDKIINQLNDVSKPLGISFSQMRTLMSQCDEVELYLLPSQKKFSNGQVISRGSRNNFVTGRGFLSSTPLVLLSGIIPGTKWCGTGDVAVSYYDLGVEPEVDRCCRAHDLCPVKIRPYSQRYNLTNDSLYTKSHCQCDDSLHKCLKHSPSPTAFIMGNIYFNLVQVPCIENFDDQGWQYRKAQNNF